MINRTFLTLFACVIPWPCLGAEPAAPPVPQRYDVRLRYRIDAFPKERVAVYDELIKYFKEIGFDKDPGLETEPTDRNSTRMTGSISSANATKLLADRHVKSLLLWPQGSKLPENDTPVRVRLELGGGHNPQGQQLLADQVRQALAPLGFKEAVGYEAHGNRELLGMIPASKLDALLEDLRKQPGADKLEVPFATQSPLLVTLVQLGLPPTKERPAAPEPAKGQEKLTPELRKLLPADKQESKVERMEVILSHAAAHSDLHWQVTLHNAAPGLSIEGRVGPLVTVKGPVTDALKLAGSGAVATVRLPRSGEPRLWLETKDLSERLKSGGLDRLAGRKGKKIRIAVVDGDFRSWQVQILDKKLPADTRFLDLTTVHNSNLVSDPMPGDPGSLGIGTGFAVAAMAAVPDADLTLIRIDPASPYQLLEVARYINGAAVHSENLANRYQELTETRKDLDLRQAAMAEEKTVAYSSVAGEEEDAARKRREEFRKKEAKLAQDEKDYRAAFDRYVQLQRDLKALKGIQAVVTLLTWNEGQPQDRPGTLSRYFEDDFFRGAFWMFVPENTRGQSWSGLFRDIDSNGVMEFAAPDTALPKDRWTRELNFLQWQPTKGDKALDLPAKSRVRVSIQWQEAHDPAVTSHNPEDYREPLAKLRLVLVRQGDPSGKMQPADDLQVVAQSVELPQQLDSHPSSATYEQTVEFEVAQPGRYALRVEGRVPPGIRPLNAPTVLAEEKRWECRPRVFLETLEGPGRLVFQDYWDK